MRFEYRAFSQCIYDTLTGWHYVGDEDTCKLLNQINDRADDNVDKVLRKYRIKDAKKLDLCLREGRVW